LQKISKHILFSEYYKTALFFSGVCKTFNPGQDDVGSVEEVCSDVLTSGMTDLQRAPEIWTLLPKINLIKLLSAFSGA